MAYEAEKKDLDYLLANRVGSSGNDLVRDKECTLAWTKIDAKRKQTVLSYLSTIVTVTDQKYDSGNATLPGLWRNAGYGYSHQGAYYFLTLREGWATSVLAASLPNDECMIQTGSDTRSDSRAYTFCWRNIASSAVNACVAALRTLGSFTNPTVQGEQKTGVYAFTNIQTAQQQDGSYWISIDSVLVKDVASVDDLKAMTPIRERIHDVENPFGREGGYAEHIGRKPTEGITLTYRALSIGSKAFLEGMTDTQLRELLPTADKDLFETVKARVAEDEANTLKLIAAFQYVPLRSTTPEADARIVGEVRFNQSGKLSLTRSWPRIDPSLVDDLLVSNANTAITADIVTDPKADGKTYSGDWLVLTTKKDMTENDGMRIVQELIKCGDQKLYTKTGTDPLHLTCEFKLWDASVTAIEAFLADPNPFDDASVDPKWETAENGITKVVRTESNADRSINLHAIYSTTANLGHIELFTAGTGAPGKLSVQDTYSSKTERGYGWNIPVANLKTYSDYYSPAVRAVNTKNDFKITRRDEHTFDFEGALQTFVTIDSGAVVIEDTAEKTVTRRSGEYVLAAKIAADQDFGPVTSPTPGTVVEVDAKPNDVGSYTVVRMQTVFHDQQSAGSSNTGTVESTATTKHTANSSEATITTPDVNLVSEVENEKRPDGLVKSVKKDTTKVPTTIVDGVIISNTAYETQALTLKVNQTSTPAASLNQVVKATHNGAGGVNVEVIAKAEVDTSSEDKVTTALETTTTTKHSASGSAATVTSPDVNIGSTVHNEITSGGKYKSEKKDVVKTPWDSNSFVVTTNLSGIIKESTKRFRNQTTIPAASTGEMVKAVENELASFDGEHIKRELTDAATGTPYVTVKSKIYEWDVDKSDIKFPVWTTSTDASVPQRITGYNVYQYRLYFYRSVEVTITRQYYVSHPSIADSLTTSVGQYGGGVAQVVQVLELGEGLYAKEIKTITTGEWTQTSGTFPYYIPVLYTPA